MSEIAIRVENLSKRYRIGQREPYKALRDVLPQLIKRISKFEIGIHLGSQGRLL